MNRDLLTNNLYRLFTLFVAGLLVSCAQATLCDQGSPEGVLSCYISAVGQGDSDAVIQIYWGETSFYLPGPVELESFKIIEKKTRGQDLDVCEDVHPGSCKEVPLWARAGTVQLDVLEEFESGDSVMYTYYMRQIHGRWYLVSHTGWNTPE